MIWEAHQRVPPRRASYLQLPSTTNKTSSCYLSVCAFDLGGIEAEIEDLHRAFWSTNNQHSEWYLYLFKLSDTIGAPFYWLYSFNLYKNRGISGISFFHLQPKLRNRLHWRVSLVEKPTFHGDFGCNRIMDAGRTKHSGATKYDSSEADLAWFRLLLWLSEKKIANVVHGGPTILSQKLTPVQTSQTRYGNFKTRRSPNPMKLPQTSQSSTFWDIFHWTYDPCPLVKPIKIDCNRLLTISKQVGTHLVLTNRYIPVWSWATYLLLSENSKKPEISKMIWTTSTVPQFRTRLQGCIVGQSMRNRPKRPQWLKDLQRPNKAPDKMR